MGLYAALGKAAIIAKQRVLSETSPGYIQGVLDRLARAPSRARHRSHGPPDGALRQTLAWRTARFGTGWSAYGWFVTHLLPSSARLWTTRSKHTCPSDEERTVTTCCHGRLSP